MNRGLLGFPQRAPVSIPALLTEIDGAVPVVTRYAAEVYAPVTAGLGRWFKADAGVTKDGSNRVSQWDDQSGNAQHATQATAGNQPLWVDGVFDGQPVLRFVSSRPDHLSVDLSLLVSSDYTITVVCSRSASGNKYLLGAINSGTNNQSLHVGWQAATNWRCGHWNSDIDAAVPDFVSGVLTSMTMIRRAGFGRKNASLLQDLTVSTNTASLTGIAGGGTIGRAVGVAFDGDLLELLIYSRALSRREQLQNELYLRWRYPSLGAFRDF